MKRIKILLYLCLLSVTGISAILNTSHAEKHSGIKLLKTQKGNVTNKLVKISVHTVYQENLVKVTIENTPDGLVITEIYTLSGTKVTENSQESNNGQIQIDLDQEQILAGNYLFFIKHQELSHSQLVYVN